MNSTPLGHAAHQIRYALYEWPNWVTTTVLILGALIVATIAHFILVRSLPRVLLDREPILRMIIARSRRPLRFALIVIALFAVVPVAPVAPNANRILLELLSAAFVCLLGWGLIIVIDALSNFKLSRQSGNLQADVVARRHVTQWQVLRQTARVLTIMVTIAAALMAFPAVRAYGVSLLASAGAAGLVVGLAARPLLSNLIAGIQIALTQPLRIEDAVVINGQWGWIEEITSTYVVVRIWNWQRMIVPLAWLLEQPFQNWTRDSSELIGIVHWNVDYTTPIDALRKKLDEIVHATPLWSGKVVVLQVTHAQATTIVLRALVSARNSGEAWDLRCHVREKMIDFLQLEYPGALPKQRVAFEGGQLPDELEADGIRPMHEMDLQDAH